MSRSYEDPSPLFKKKIGLIGSSYLTEQPFEDIKIVGEDFQANFYG